MIKIAESLGNIDLYCQLTERTEIDVIMLTLNGIFVFESKNYRGWVYGHEKQKQWNLGVDMAFLQNRVRLSVDAFLIKNKDLLMSHSLPTTTGFSSTIENIGAIENKGLEFALNANLVRAKACQLYTNPIEVT